jgi:WD40 repeat protein
VQPNRCLLPRHFCAKLGLKVWDLASGRLLRTLEGHTGELHAVAVTPDGRQIVSGSWEHALSLKVWDLESGQLLRSLDSPVLWANAVAITPNGRQIVSGSNDSPLKVWDLEGGQLVGLLEGHSKRVLAAAITPDGRQVVSGSADRTVKVWDISTPLNSGPARSGRPLSLLETHTDSIVGVAVTPDGRQVVTGSRDGTIRLWDLVEDASRVLFWNDAPIKCLAISLDGHHVCCGDEAGRVWLFELIGAGAPVVPNPATASASEG